MYAHLNENKSTLVQYLDIVHPRLLGVTILRKPSNKWKTFCIGWAVYYVYREESARALAVAVSRQAEGGAVAAPAVDLAVGPVVDRGGVQAAAAVGAGEAPLVPTLNTKVLLWILIHGDLSFCTCIIFDEPHLSGRHHLLRGEDPVVTPETVNMFCKPKYFFQPTNIFLYPRSQHLGHPSSPSACSSLSDTPGWKSMSARVSSCAPSPGLAATSAGRLPEPPQP